MFTDQEVQEQRLDAFNLMLQVQVYVTNAPHHLFPDQLRWALNDTIDRLEHPPTPGVGWPSHGGTVHQGEP